MVEEREVNSFSNLSSSSEVQAYQLLTGRCVNFLNSLTSLHGKAGRHDYYADHGRWLQREYKKVPTG